MIALALIVKGEKSEAPFLKQCLELNAPYVDGVFVTITYKNKPDKEIVDVVKLFTDNISYFKWVNDFAAARNFNFSQVPKEYEYILWLDADDGLRGIENLKEVIKKNPADAYIVNYLYAFDEYKNPIVVHAKTQVVKNGSVTWVGELHEDFKPNRELKTYFIKDIERIHLSTPERFESAKKRNLEVALSQVKKYPDDPRSYWNLGNSYKALNKGKEAIEAFEKFLSLSNSDDEKYIVYLRMAETYWLMKDKKAIDQARYAIGLFPELPDAYHMLGSLYLESGKYKKAEEMYLAGLSKIGRLNLRILVHNPRDYDYVPLMNLAKVYFNLSRPDMALPCLEACLKIYPKDENIKNLIKLIKKEKAKFDKVIKVVAKLTKLPDDKLKKELEKIPDEFKAHPAVCNLRNTRFIKQESSGKEVSIFCGYTEEEWSPVKGLGGSEEAIVNLASRLQKRGWEVTVYNNCGHKELEFDGVKYKPFWAWNYRDKQDVVILWRSPKMADYEINCRTLIIDLHDVIPNGEFTEERLKKIDKIFVKSNFHRSLYSEIPDDKFVIVPNGIDYQYFTKEVEKDPYLLINTSSPDRSLSSLLAGFEKIKKAVPQAKLKWAYGWNVFDIVHGDNLKVMQWKNEMKEKMKELGVEELGRLSPEEVNELYLKASIFAYPTEFAEIDCISLTKAIAAGCFPVTSDFAALGEKPYGYQVHSDKTKDNWAKPYQFDFSLEKVDEWADLVIKALKERPDTKEMRKWASKFDWELITDVWHKTLTQL